MMASITRALRWRTVLVAAILSTIAIAAVLGSALTSRGNAAQDESAIKANIAGWITVFNGCFEVPADAISTVEARQAQVKAAHLKPIDSTSQDHLQILPDDAQAVMNARWQKLMTYLTSQYAAAGSKNDFVAQMDEGLYNNPAEAPVTDVQTKVLAIDCKQLTSSTCVAWAYYWDGDVSADGSRMQNWGVDEFRLLNVNGKWLIDNVNPLGTLCQPEGTMWNTTHGQWGPSAPREPIITGEWSGSLLYPGQAVPLDQIEALMNSASP